MKKTDILLAWRDADYFASLSDEEKAALPANPAALPEVQDEILGSVAGGCAFTAGFCPTSALCTPCNPYECAA